jgi:ribonuclease T2
MGIVSRFARAALAVLALAAAGTTPLAAQTANQAGVYDYYVLSLSWTPAFCDRTGGKGDPNQCAPGVKAGFVLHGLWPEFDAGGWPENCPTVAKVPPTVIDALLEVMPSAGLIEHEWGKHGSCTGMTPDDYFAETRASWERVRIPEAFYSAAEPMAVPADEVERAFVAANELFQLTPDAIAMACDAKGVTEVSICLDKDLNFRSCGKGVADTCRKGDKLIAK